MTGNIIAYIVVIISKVYKIIYIALCKVIRNPIHMWINCRTTVCFC